MPHPEDSVVMRGEEEVVVVLVEIVKEVTDVVIKVIRKVVLLVTLTRLSVVVMVCYKHLDLLVAWSANTASLFRSWTWWCSPFVDIFVVWNLGALKLWLAFSITVGERCIMLF
jgi:hypothetical protein